MCFRFSIKQNICLKMDEQQQLWQNYKKNYTLDIANVTLIAS